MPRFFVEADALRGKFAVLSGETATHAKVLRLKCGDKVTLCTGDGTDHECVISDISPGLVSLAVQSSVPSAAEAKTKIAVYMAFSKGDKTEHVVQKATELGVSELVLFPSERCVSRPDDKSLEKKRERWQKIAAAAAEQSGRGQIPAVRTAGSFLHAVRDAACAELSVLLYENEEHLSLRRALGQRTFRSIALMTGPEGGFAEAEVAAARQEGLQICTLGPRILRCETAPLCALTACMFACGELD